ncbi:MAG: hypothetical protein HOC91_01670 [Nitrospinaceae bacterium]|nr:hypothetical protein [Nitrospinaceae bacterium]MBT4429203.1 hypothetical protein [Nitrospinaceae bacterium]MBT5947203.1 hypothetical protein [Nitrospinaceae bacterium]MBT6393813.1 hypothetical protein [Nitrospinaceae bacterium]MBT7856527.1 hypothetical protein [Nitrospinaceae bacterium]
MKAADLNMTQDILGHARFHFITLTLEEEDPALVEDMGTLCKMMENMHVIQGHPTTEAFRRGRFQYLRAEPLKSREKDIPHPEVAKADVLVRTECATPETLENYEEGLRTLIEERGGSVETLQGIQKSRSYTSYAMTQFAYAPALAPASGEHLPLAVVTPQRKTREWWEMDWMRRESFFLPRYDANGRMAAKGHALATEAGIPCINRRLFHHPEGYGLPEGYDFVGYFEFAEKSAESFRSVMASLRNTSVNPEWEYVKEGPEWWGRRVGLTKDLWRN